MQISLTNIELGENDDRLSDSDIEEYHVWRSLSAILIDRNQNPTKTTKAWVLHYRIVDDIENKMSSFEPTAGKENYNAYRDAIDQNVRKATELYAEFSKQLAVVAPYIAADQNQLLLPTKYPEIFENLDESLSLEEGLPVKLVICPGLRRRGNAQGEHYGETIILQKFPALYVSAIKGEQTPRNSIQRSRGASTRRPSSSRHSSSSRRPSYSSETSAASIHDVGFCLQGQEAARNPVQIPVHSEKKNLFRARMKRKASFRNPLQK